MTPDPSIEAAIQRVREYIDSHDEVPLHVAIRHNADDPTFWFNTIDNMIAGCDESDDALVRSLVMIAATAIESIDYITTYHPIRNTKGSE